MPHWYFGFDDRRRRHCLMDFFPDADARFVASVTLNVLLSLATLAFSRDQCSRIGISSPFFIGSGRHLPSLD